MHPFNACMRKLILGVGGGEVPGPSARDPPPGTHTQQTSQDYSESARETAQEGEPQASSPTSLRWGMRWPDAAWGIMRRGPGWKAPGPVTPHLARPMPGGTPPHCRPEEHWPSGSIHPTPQEKIPAGLQVMGQREPRTLGQGTALP